MSTAMLPSNGSGMTFGLTPEASNADSSSSSSSSSTSTPTYKVPKFLRSLYSILQNEDESIVKWVQNQELKPNRVTAFHILDLARFENEVLPKHFKHSKFASFQRQLNNFGFRKWTKTQSSGVCTFSHNSFPPDPREIGVLRASIREQWRQKNNDTRRRVGNGITKAERKLQQQVQQQVQQLQQTGSNPASNQAPQSPAPGKYDDDDETSEFGSPSRVDSFSAMLKTPLDGPAPRAPTHQPQIKKLARPMGGEWVSGGLEAFGDHAPMNAGKPALLPSLQVSSQPQSRHLPHVSYNNTINIGTFPYHHHETSPVYAPQAPPMMMMSSTPTQLEPWAWEPHTAPAAYFEVAPWTVHQDPSLVHKAPMYCHAPEQQVSPSSMEEFTFDSIMLFNE